LIKYDIENDDYIRDKNGFCIECGPGEVGELVAKMEETRLSVARGGQFAGYTDPKATEKKIMKNVFEKGDAWFRTGDLLKFDKEGYYYFVDRIGDTFRW
jgi:fatty-acyl-CoA synthase